MATANDLMNAVASFLGRDRASFYRNGFDCLLQAVNNARLYAERVVDFELSRVSVKVPNVDIVSGGSLDNAVLFSDGVTAVSVKKVKKCFIMMAGSNAAYPVAFYSRDKWLNRVRRKIERLAPLDLTFWLPTTSDWVTQALSTLHQFAVIQMGRTVYLTPADRNAVGSTFNLYFDVLKWLPRYGTTAITGNATSTLTGSLVASGATFITSGVQVGMVVRNTTTNATAMVTAVVSNTTLTLSENIFVSGNAYSILVANETDFLIDSCFDWLMYRSIWELNFFLKEDERVQLSQTLINDAWNGLTSWNENLISQSTDDIDLD